MKVTVEQMIPGLESKNSHAILTVEVGTNAAGKRIPLIRQALQRLIDQLDEIEQRFYPKEGR